MHFLFTSSYRQTNKPVFKGYIPIDCSSATQTITSMTLTTTGTDGIGGSLENGDYCVLVTNTTLFGGTITPGLTINGSLATVTSLRSASVTEYLFNTVNVGKFRVTASPTTLVVGNNSAGTIVAPAAGTNSIYEGMVGYILVFNSELNASGIQTNSTVTNGGTLGAISVDSRPGVFSFFVAGGGASSTTAWNNRANSSNQLAQAANRSAYFNGILVGWGWEQSFTTSTLTGQSALTGIVGTQFYLAASP